LKQSSEIKDRVIDATRQLGKLNGVVHCAGIPYISPLKSISESITRDVFLLNTYSAIELAKVFINRNVCSGQNDSIVLISSIYGCVGSAANVGYALSKSALHGITKSLAIELAARNIRVNCIAPGFVKSDMLTNVSSKISTPEYNEKIAQLHPLGLGSPGDVANMIAFLISDMSTWITGSILNVDGGFTAQ
jgi:NAD(P)-dependent dehydrogenase (short-subunit alcohol dehydrogenase family)